MAQKKAVFGENLSKTLKLRRQQVTVSQKHNSLLNVIFHQHSTLSTFYERYSALLPELIALHTKINSAFSGNSITDTT